MAREEQDQSAPFDLYSLAQGIHWSGNLLCREFNRFYCCCWGHVCEFKFSWSGRMDIQLNSIINIDAESVESNIAVSEPSGGLQKGGFAKHTHRWVSYMVGS